MAKNKTPHKVPKPAAVPPEEKQEVPLIWPLARATSSLEACYKVRFSPEDIVTTSVAAQDIHAQLYAAEMGYRETYNALYPSKTGKATMLSANMVTAEIGFLYSDAPLSEGYIGSLDFAHTPVRVPITVPHYTFNVADFFDSTVSYNALGGANKGGRNKTFNEHLTQRIGLFSQYRQFEVTNAITNNTGFGAEVLKGNFHETFHHSEQAIMEFFSGTIGRKLITQELQTLGAETVGAITLDMYSTRYMCPNCNVHLIGFQSTQKAGAIYDITQALHGVGVRIDTPEEGLLWSTRVSASSSGKGTQDSPTKKTGDSKAVHNLSYADRHVVLQGDSGKLALAAKVEERRYSFGSFSGDFFTSREVRKKAMETHLGNRGCFK